MILLQLGSEPAKTEQLADWAEGERALGVGLLRQKTFRSTTDKPVEERF